MEQENMGQSGVSQFPGALDDNRTIEVKAQDYKAEEIASLSAVEWREKPQDQWAKYPVRNQKIRSSCVAETGALMLGIDNLREEGRFVTLSSVDMYNRRANKPGLGMFGYDALDILKNKGITLEHFIPSDDLTDAQADALTRKVSDEQVGKIFKAGGYVQLPFDLERIASFMEQGRVNGVCKPVMMWFRFHTSEWTGEPLSNGKEPNAHHSVTGTDYFIYKGRKVIMLQDSWGLAWSTFDGRRVIDQDWIDRHMTYCAAVADLSNAWREGQEQPQPSPVPVPPKPTKPKFYFGRNLNYSETSNDVKKLQEILRYEGFFPTNTELTGRYLQITAKGVKEFQLKHKVGTAAEINALQGKTVGPKTRSKLNQLYA